MLVVILLGANQFLSSTKTYLSRLDDCCYVGWVVKLMAIVFYRKKITLKEFPSAVPMLCGLHCVLTLHKVSLCLSLIEQFLLECRKTKTDAGNLVNQSEREANTCSRRQAQKNAVQASYDWFWFYSFTSDWLIKWREFF